MSDVVRTILASTLSLALVACGDDGGGTGPGTPDAAVNPNTGDYTEYVLSQLTLPDQGSAADLAFNVDGIDDMKDNKLGAVLSIIPGDLQGSVDNAVAAGSLVLLSALRADSLTSDDAALWQVWLGNGVTTPPTPGAMYTIDPAGPDDATVVGSVAGGTFEGKNGIVALSIPLLEGAPPLQITLYGAAIRVKVSADDYTDTSASDLGRLGGAIKEEDLVTDVLPVVATFASMVIIGDDDDPAPDDPPTGDGDGMPDCACAGTPSVRTCQSSNSTAAQVAGLLDTDNDCMVTVAELMSNTLVSSTLNPDVDLFDANGNYNPGMEGEEGYDAISLGVGINGIRAMFARPGE
jgi:hypothetical protein